MMFGALKCAHVGVSIVNDPDFESSVERSVNPTQAEAGSKKPRVRVLKIG